MIIEASNLAKERAGNTALDVGCEGGRWSVELANLGWNLICTDIDPESIAICQERIPAAKCILVGQSSQVLPSESSTVNLLLCIEAFPVIRSDWFISEAHRVLCPGGVLVAVFLNQRSLRAYFHDWAHAHQGLEDYYGVAYPTWRSKMRRQGFSFFSEQGFCWGPFSRHSNSVLVPAFAKVERVLGLNRLISVSPWIALSAEKRIA